MATRKCFFCLQKDNQLGEREVDFHFYPGFALCQKQKNIDAFHSSIRQIFPGANVLEVSSKSKQPLGISLSAFNLTMSINGRQYPVETIFQSSKVFEDGGPYLDLLSVSPVKAKHDERLRTGSRLIGFIFQRKDYPIIPKTAFYDWIYCLALCQHEDLVRDVLKYEVFTDIEFNHQKSINCQARSTSIFVWLARGGKLRTAMQDIETFVKTVYSDPEGCVRQISLFDKEQNHDDV